MCRCFADGVNGVSSVPSENDIHEAASPWMLCHVNGEPHMEQKLRVTPGDESWLRISSVPADTTRSPIGTLP